MMNLSGVALRAHVRVFGKDPGYTIANLEKAAATHTIKQICINTRTCLLATGRVLVFIQS